MTKKSTAKSGSALVIVESPAKARTISKFLGKGFQVEASIGHVRDLPNGAKELPAQFKKESWAYLGVNVDSEFAPIYVIPANKRDQVKKLKAALKNASELYLATDEDREGEAISWHLCELLAPRVPVRRLVFHEITEEAIREALQQPREINDGLVRAQETRRILDRLYGYEVSPLLWRKVKPKLSAGRVQSVAVRMIVEREEARRSFRAAEYWDLLAQLATPSQESLEATLISVADRRLATGRDFDAETGALIHRELVHLDRAAAESLAARLRNADFRVIKVEEKPFTSKPAAPFTTSTLQQEANRKLGFTAKRTMAAAQSLYENGYITYMRTDSTNLASVAIEAARDLVRSEYGAEFLPTSPRMYKSKVKNAQEAHEAIRPSGHPFSLPAALRSELNDDQFRLFELIWKRTIASQMTDARGRRMTIAIQADDAVFQVTGTTIDFPGFLRAYVEGSDDPDAELADRERIVPRLAPGDRLICLDLQPKQHLTQPPPRFTEASLTKALEEKGIGRPSTYATIIETIQQREYVFKRGNALVPSWTAFSVCRLLKEHLSYLVDFEFTAQMEDELDAISRGETGHVEYLRRFYFGNGHPGLKKVLEHKVEQIDARDVSRFAIGRPDDNDQSEMIYVRVGRYGPFLEWGDRRASIPEDLPPDELNLTKALELFSKSQQGEEPLGRCPETGRPVFLKVGRFGPYVQLGSADDEGKKNASLPKGIDPTTVTLEMALKVLQLPRTVGIHPDLQQPIVAHNGRFGPFIKCGDETRTLPAGVTPLDVTLDQAVHLLAQPKTRGRQAVTREPLRVLGDSPLTNKPIQVLSGRFGPYVTDGVTNASLPKDLVVEEMSLEQALNILAERAAKGPATKTARKRSAARSNSPSDNGLKSAGRSAKGTPKKSSKASNKKSARKTTAGR